MLESGQILQGRYQLQTRLGNHSGRQTWLAVDLGIESAIAVPVIVKLLAFNAEMQWDEFKLFERETQVLRQLNHPRIPQYRDAFTIEQQLGGLHWLGLVQNYIPGNSLQQLLAAGKHFTEAKVQSIAKGVLEILIYLHELSPPILHRDIKPSNLILSADGQVYLVDFGAVQNRAAREGATFTVVGSSGYTPLEQFWGRAVPASDLYALGATLIHLLTGIAPADLPQQSLQIQFSDRVSVNPSFVRWIQAIAHPDLDQRFTSARQALEALSTQDFLTTSSAKISQPSSTPIQVKKSVQELTIQISQQNLGWSGVAKVGLRLLQTFCLLPFLLLNSFLISGCFWGLLLTAMMFALEAGYNWVHYLPQILGFLGLTSFLIGTWIAISKALIKILVTLTQELFTAARNYRLDFKSDQFILEWRLFNYCYHRLSGNTREIKTIKNLSFSGITIETQVGCYQLAPGLTPSESDWLAQEIENWL